MSGVGGGGYLAAGSLRGRGRTGLSTAGLVQGVLGGFTDGSGMPGEPARLLADANAEASRGLAPIGAAVVGARLAAGGAFSLLVGKKPDEATFAKLRKPTAEGDDPNAAQNGGGQKQAGSGRLGGGPKDRYRDDDGTVIDPDTGEVLHDQKTDRTLLSTRAHNRLVRLRGYRLAHRGGRFAYASTMGLPTTVRTTQAGASRATHDTRQQLRVWGNTVRQDRRGWASSAQGAKNLINQAGVQNASASSRRLPLPPRPRRQHAARCSRLAAPRRPRRPERPGAAGSQAVRDPRPGPWPVRAQAQAPVPPVPGRGRGRGLRRVLDPLHLARPLRLTHPQRLRPRRLRAVAAPCRRVHSPGRASVAEQVPPIPPGRHRRCSAESRSATPKTRARFYRRQR